MIDKLMTINREHIIAAAKEAGSNRPFPTGLEFIDVSLLERFYAIAFKAGVDATVPKAFAAGAASRDAEIAELVAALDRIINGPWPSDMEGPEDQCRFDRDIATAALAKVRKP